MTVITPESPTQPQSSIQPSVQLSAQQISVQPDPQSVQTLVIIDRAVKDYDHLASGVVPDAAVVGLDASQNGIRHITSLLWNYPNLTSLHIVSHGSPGGILLGTTELTLERLDLYLGYLQSWGDSLKDGAVLLYGCEVAQGDRGRTFVQRLSEFTRTAIAASSALTGSTAKGGTWNLEVKTGWRDTKPLPSAFCPMTLAAYSGLFMANS